VADDGFDVLELKLPEEVLKISGQRLFG